MHLSFDVSTKLQRNDVKGYINHVFRKSDDRDLRHSNEEIDDDRTKYNIDFTIDGKSFDERLAHRLKSYNSITKTGKVRNLRSDAVIARGFLLQPSAEMFENKSLKEKKALMKKFTEDALPFVAAEFGGYVNVLGASVHLDETNPHLHVGVCPMTEDGRLSQKDFFKGPRHLANMHKKFRKHMNERGWDFEVENKQEDTKHYSDSDYKRNAKAIESARDEYTARKRSYNKEFDDLSAEREKIEHERNQLAEERRLFEENQRRENEALRARKRALDEEVKEEYQKARETAEIDALTSFRSVLMNLYENTYLAERITREFNKAINRPFLGFQPVGLGGSKALEEEKKQSVNEQVKRASEALDLEL